MGQTHQSDLELVNSDIDIDSCTSHRLNSDIKDSVHEAGHNHLTEIIVCLDSLTQEIHHYAISMPGLYHANVSDSDVGQHLGKSRYNPWWNTSLIQSSLEPVSQLIFYDSSIISARILPHTVNQINNVR